MAEYWKLDVADKDEFKIEMLEADSLPDLLRQELTKAYSDDRFEACYDTTGTFSVDENRLTWEPGDGGVYTIALYFENTEEGQKIFHNEIKDRYDNR